MTSTPLSTVAAPTAAAEDPPAVVILRWDRETGWGWVAHGRGAESRFAGFVQLADPTALPATITELGWTFIASHDCGRGLVETEIHIRLPPGPTPRDQPVADTAATARRL